uniref:RNA polymerase sigma factor n=1 Tax=Arthrobacter terrae TaxID=2935737 RepID=UPI0035E40EA4
MTTNADIIRRSRESPQAFTELYDKYARMIHRYAVRRAGESAAEDVMAETFLVAFERRDSFDHARDDAWPWLFGIATNLLRKHHRAEAKSLKVLTKSSGRDSYADSTERIAVAIQCELLQRSPQQHSKRDSSSTSSSGVTSAYWCSTAGSGRRSGPRSRRVPGRRCTVSSPR